MQIFHLNAATLSRIFSFSFEEPLGRSIYSFYELPEQILKEVDHMCVGLGSGEQRSGLSPGSVPWILSPARGRSCL